MAGSSTGYPHRMRTSVEFAEPRTPPAAQYGSTSRSSGSFVTTTPPPMTEFGVPGAASTSSCGTGGTGGSEPRPILRHQNTSVRISSPLRKQVGFEDKPRLRPVLKQSHSASGPLNSPRGGTQDVPRPSLRERRGRGRAQVSWAQTIAVPQSSSEFLEEQSAERPMNPRRSMDQTSFSSDGHGRRSFGRMGYRNSEARSLDSRRSFDARSLDSRRSFDARSLDSRRSFASASIDGHGRPALRPSRSLGSYGRSGNRPHSTASTTPSAAGLWFDVPPPLPPHPSTCMPGFPAQEFSDHRPPKFSRELLRRPGIVMPKPAMRPASIATDRVAAYKDVAPARQPSVTRQFSGFLTRKLSKRSSSHFPPSGSSSTAKARPSITPIPVGMPSSMPITPVGQYSNMDHMSPMTPPHRSPVSMGPGMTDKPNSEYVQWPQQSMQGRFRGSALPPGAGYFLPPDAASSVPGSASRGLPPGAMTKRPDIMQSHGMAMPASIQPPPHTLSHQEAARQALRHYRSSPASLRVTSLHQVPEMGLPTQWVERVPPPPPSPLGYGFSEEEEEEEDEDEDDDLVVVHPPVFTSSLRAEPKLTDYVQHRPPHLSVDFGSGNLWADLESSFGALSLPDLPGHDDDDAGSAGSDESHTTNATTTTHATHTTFTAHSHATAPLSPRRTALSEVGHSANVPPRAYSDVGHSSAPVVRVGVTYSDTGHGHSSAKVSHSHRATYSDHGSEDMYSPLGSPVRAMSSHRAASESECQPVYWPSTSHKLSASAPGTPLLGAMGHHSSRSPIPNRLVSVGGDIRPPPRGQSLVASTLGATSSRPMFSTSSHMLNTPPRRTSSRSPSSMSLRSSTSMHSEASTISSLPSTMTSMTTASSAASVEMPDPIAEDGDEEIAVDVFGIVRADKYLEQRSQHHKPCRPVPFGDMSSSPSMPDSVERAEIRRVQRAKSSVATLRVRTLA